MRSQITGFIGLACALLLTGELAAAQGFSASYFNNRSLSGEPVVTQIDSSINFNWGVAAPVEGTTGRNFSVRWAGYIKAPSDGEYQLLVTVNGGVRVWMHGGLVIDEWRDQKLQTFMAEPLVYDGDEWIPLIMEFYADGTRAEASLMWQQPAHGREIIPASAWTAPGLVGDYFANMDLTPPAVSSRNDATIDFKWGPSAPAPAVPADVFSVRWTGSLTPADSDGYRFIARSDDGVRVLVDGELVIDRWKNGGAQDYYSAPIQLTAGQTYAVVVEYYDDHGNAEMKLSWERAPANKIVLPPELAFAYDHDLLPVRSTASPASIEGVAVDGRLPSVVVDGQAIAVLPLGDRGWHANVPLQTVGPAEIAITHPGLPTVEHQLSWQSTALSQPHDVVIRVDDSLFFELLPGSEVTILTESGIASGPSVVPQSGVLECAFPHSGYYTVVGASATGADLGAAEVVVVETSIASKRLIQGLGHTRSYDLTTLPASVELDWSGLGMIEVSVDDAIPSDEDFTLNAQVTRRGVPYVVARIPGSQAIAFAGEVEEFTHRVVGPKTGILNWDDPVVTRQLELRPFLPDVWFKLRIFAGQALLEGGVKNGSINSSNLTDLPNNLPDILPGIFEQVYDEETGEVIGLYNYTIDLVEGSKLCHRVRAGVSNSPWVEIGDSDSDNPEFCKIRTFSSLVFMQETNEDEVEESGNPEEWSSRTWSILAEEEDETDELEYKIVVSDPPGSGSEVDNPMPALFGGSENESECQICDASCGAVSPTMDSGTIPGEYSLQIQDCEGEESPVDSTKFWVAKLDVHGAGSDTKAQFNELTTVLPRRPGSVVEPVIQMDMGGDGSVNGCSLYGYTECEEKNVWEFTAVAKNENGQGENIPDDVEIVWSGVPYEEISSKSNNRGSWPEKIRCELPPGRYVPRLEVYLFDGQDRLLVGEAEIHDIVVEELRSDEAGRPNIVQRTVGQIAAASARADRSIDAKISIGGSSRGRISIDGYQQNEYWVTSSDSGDLGQVVTIQDAETIDIYLQGYGAATTSEDGLEVLAEGQAFIESCDEPCSDPSVVEFEGAAATVSWQETDRETFDSVIMSAKIKIHDGEADRVEDAHWYEYAHDPTPNLSFNISNIELVGDNDMSFTVTGTIVDRASEVATNASAITESIDIYVGNEVVDTISLTYGAAADDYSRRSLNGEFEQQVYAYGVGKNHSVQVSLKSNSGIGEDYEAIAMQAIPINETLVETAIRESEGVVTSSATSSATVTQDIQPTGYWRVYEVMEAIDYREKNGAIIKEFDDSDAGSELAIGPQSPLIKGERTRVVLDFGEFLPPQREEVAVWVRVRSEGAEPRNKLFVEIRDANRKKLVKRKAKFKTQGYGWLPLGSIDLNALPEEKLFLHARLSIGQPVLDQILITSDFDYIPQRTSEAPDRYEFVAERSVGEPIQVITSELNYYNSYQMEVVWDTSRQDLLPKVKVGSLDAEVSD